MHEGNPLNGSINTTATTAAVIIGTVATLGPAAIKKAKEIYDRYGEKSKKEMSLIQKAYIECCYNVEANSSVTLLDKKKPDTSQVGNINHQLPVHFQMNPAGNFPLVYHNGFLPEKDLLVWLRKLGESNLRQYIEDMLGYIIEYQIYRNINILSKNIDLFKGINLSDEFSYDPTNLFFEEFKSWLIELSKASPIDEKLLLLVKARIAYLDQIKDNQVFTIDEKVNPTRLQVIIHIKDILKSGVVPFIQLEISRMCSRDYFKILKFDLEMTIRSALQFLLYSFRNNEELPHAFIIGEIRNPTLPGYRYAMETISGQLLQICVNSGPMLLVCRKLEINKPALPQALIQKENKSQVDIFEYNFIDVSNNIIYPLVDEKNIITIKNWYNEDNSGILKQFREPELMNEYLKLHGQIQKLAMFGVIIDEFYDLAGIGGELAVYIVAKKQIESAIDCSKQLLDAVRSTIDYLFHAAETFQESMINKEESKRVAWLKSFPSIRAAHTRFKQKSDECLRILNKINQDKVKVNSKKYANLVIKKTEFLSHCVDRFVKLSIDRQNLQTPHLPNEIINYSSNPNSLFHHSTGSEEKDYLKSTMTSIKHFDKQALFNDAQQKVFMKNYNHALFILNKLINTNESSNDTAILITRACVYYGLEKYRDAVMDLKSIFVKEKDNPQANNLFKNIIVRHLANAEEYIRVNNHRAALENLQFIFEFGDEEYKIKANKLYSQLNEIPRNNLQCI